MTDDIIMRIYHGLYLATITPLVQIPADPSPLLEVFKVKCVDLLVQTFNLILLTSSKPFCLCTIISQSYSKSDLRVIVMISMTMAKKPIYIKLLVPQLCCHFLPIPPCSFLPCSISVGEKNIIFGRDFGIPPVYGKTSLYK